ncbi:putative pyridoxamine phosphate oxidase protein [Lasiodiplodia theobromae]|uniref:Pyridoxamine phosphate oxidase n=1 Tax=Lasiodiplodia theobromae TaxID=45133 RepID=UPI0015C359E0|nr:Pyridoxamine phosphate oxidase [Lasiodiplodia theobromae]KAF4540511.1 Pyridoxamine phosphate oxidase [Lasiodiplodia theobromae]KAF9640291.1 putative pyridoxamine phosphate oxidase protein [Lasiodiplodia theobromae]
MPKFYPSLSSDLAEWLLAQPLFFVASAPIAGAHVNVSPKGLPSHSLAIINQNQVAYLDATGSGCETISHIYENGRVTLMACSFGTSPRIMRLFCTGRVVERNSRQFDEWVAKTGIKEGIKACRAVIVLDVFKVQTSCGYGVPVLSPKGSPQEHAEDDVESDAAAKYWEDRDTMSNWATKMLAKDGAIQGYQRQNNSYSLDGCPGLKSARKSCGEILMLGDVRARTRRMVVGEWGAVVLGAVLMLLGIMMARAAGLVDITVKM